MRESDVKFDANYCIYGIEVAQQLSQVTIELSDGLAAVDEDLSEDYKKRIVHFVNNSDKWFDKAKKKILDDVGDIDGLQLMVIYVLFEQISSIGVFGLLYNLNADREHGRGMKVVDGIYEIAEYGLGDVAFL